mgnify:CR=1 FL=1
MIDTNVILQQVDSLYAQNKGQEAQQRLVESIRQAVAAEDDESLLMLLNELMGYYRETSAVEESFRIAEQAIALADRMGLQGALPYAGTMMNAANAYRAGGRFSDSLDCYQNALEIYEEQLAPDDMLMAGLHNNISLLYQEMGQFGKAWENLHKALAIVEKKPEAAFETAVTCANLAATCLELGRNQEAAEAGRRSVEIFEREGIRDAHYCAALSSMGTYYFKNREFDKAEKYFRRAMAGVKESLGENEFYHRLAENAKACAAAMKEQQQYQKTMIPGRKLCRAYYEAYGKAMIQEKFPVYEGKIAVGLAGEGSDCFGYDDELSTDHDWGPGFCLWLNPETYDEIGEALQQAYEELPAEFMGCRRRVSSHGRERTGVMTVNHFYQRLLGAADYETVDWRKVSDSALAAAVNGEVFRDDEGLFSAIREALLQGYPEPIWYLKIAESAARFSQSGQYNYRRMLLRGDMVSARIMLAECQKEAMRLCYYIAGKYPPHDKWLHRGLQDLPQGREIYDILEDYTDIEMVERLGKSLSHQLYSAGFISDTTDYLDSHTDELLMKSVFAQKTSEDLVGEIAEMEFDAFDKVRNVDGRAVCQNDWPTFSIMRRSQYLTWSRPMLLQYLYDFKREYARGHNLIEEKYGRMMASTAPMEYEKIAAHFPVIDEQKKAIIEAIVQMQVAWMEEFEQQYPALAGNARSVHTAEDSLDNTSYETYLRGEISTYSDRMLELYGRYVVAYAGENRNLTEAIMMNTAKLYGYKSLAEAEEKIIN